MSILSHLASQTPDRTQAPNRAAAEQCLADPALLAEIAGGLAMPDPALAGDCAEVLTMVAQARPELAALHAAAWLPLLAHKTTRVRWEAMHALALVTPVVPGLVEPQLPRLASTVRADPSTIVRDYAIDALGSYAATSSAAARAALPLLAEALSAWNGKHRARALKGLVHAHRGDPALAPRLFALAEPYFDDKKASVRKAAREVRKCVGE